MARAWLVSPLWIMALSLAGCAGPVTTYHDIEGGAIAQPRQAPPGADAPYPNLASVPQTPTPLTEQQIEIVGSRLAPVPAPQPALVPNPVVLEGLELPAGVPPAPDIPGVYIPSTPAPHKLTYKQPPPAPAPPAPQDGAPISLAFRPGSAVLDAKTVTALTALAVSRGDATVLAGGFGSPGAVADAGALQLAVERARAIADALTAAGVPAEDVTMVAGSDGNGGFAQLVY